MNTRRLIAIAAAAGIVASLAACTTTSSTSSTSGAASATLSLGSTVAPQSFDPAGVGDSNFIPYAETAYDSLLLRKADGTIAPMLATKWDLASDNTSITLTLRSGVTFSDGAKFDAAAVKANLEHFQAGKGPLAAELGSLKTVTVVDASTVKLDYSSPDPDILFNLSDAAGRMASPADLGKTSLKTVPVGTGPYVMDTAATVQGSTYTFTARKGYWDKSLQKYGKVVFHIYPDEVGLLNALKSKQVDAGNLSDTDNRASAKASGLQVLIPKYNVTWSGLLFFDRNGSINPAFKDVRVRQAIAKAFNVSEIISALYNKTGVPNNQIFNQQSPAYDTSLNSSFSYDLTAAKQLMSDAGYAKGFNLTIPIVGFTTPATQAMLKSTLAQLNITVSFHTDATIPDYFASMLSGKYPLGYSLLGAVPTDWTVINSYLKPDSTWNPEHSTDPTLEALIASYPSSTASEQGAIASKINKFVIDNVWFAPQLWLQEQYFVNSGTKVELQSLQNVPAIYNYSPSK